MQDFWRSISKSISSEQLGWELGWTMVYFIVAGALLWAFAALLRRSMRSFSAQSRYAASLVCLALLASLAPATFFAVRTYPEELMLLHPAAQPAGQITATGEAIGLQSPFVGDRLRKTSDTPPADRLAAAWREFRAALTDEKLAPAVSAILPRLPWIWLVGTSLMLLYFSCGLMGADRLRRECDSLDQDELGGLLKRLSREMGVSRQVLIGMSDRVAAPLVLGVLRPMILLPMSVVSSLSVDQLEFVLLHELAHVRRHDNLVNLLQRFVEAIAFFHPAAWRISAWVRLEREHCCDAAVLRRRSSPSAYAETLASLAMPGISAPYAVASLANHQLVSRVRHIMQAKEPSMRFSSKWFVATAMALLTTGGFVAAFAQNPDKPEAKKPDEKSEVGDTFTIEFALDNQGVLQLQAAPDATYASVAELLKTMASTLEKEGKHPQIKVKTKAQEKTWGTWAAANCQSCHQDAHHQEGTTKADVTFSLNDTCRPGVTRWLESAVVLDKPKVEVKAGEVLQAVRIADQALLSEAVVTTLDLPTREVELLLDQSITSGQAAPAWSVKQAAGPPNTFVLGDQNTAWASKSPDGQGEWLLLSYDAPVEISAVLIHETFNPGAVARVDAILPDNDVIVLWSGEPQAVKTDSPRLFLCKPKKAVKAARIRVTIASDVVNGWNEIDAVGILDADGKVHWAKDASASSSYGDSTAKEGESAVKRHFREYHVPIRSGADKKLEWRTQRVREHKAEPSKAEGKEFGIEVKNKVESGWFQGIVADATKLDPNVKPAPSQNDAKTAIDVQLGLESITNRAPAVNLEMALESIPNRDSATLAGLQFLGLRVDSDVAKAWEGKSDADKLKALEMELELLQKQLDALRSKLKAK